MNTEIVEETHTTITMEELSKLMKLPVGDETRFQFIYNATRPMESTMRFVVTKYFPPKVAKPEQSLPA